MAWGRRWQTAKFSSQPPARLAVHRMMPVRKAKKMVPLWVG